MEGGRVRISQGILEKNKKVVEVAAAGAGV